MLGVRAPAPRASAASTPSTASTCASAAARSSGSSAPTARARPPSATWSPGSSSPTAAAIELDGVEVGRWSPERRARSGLGRSFQDARLFPSLTVAENLAQGLERHLAVHDHLSAALGLPAVWEQEDEVGWTVADLVELMGLGPYRDSFGRELSTGTRRVVDLAMILAHNPSVLLLDEPSSGIAQKEAEELGPLLRRVRDETGCAMLVIAHDMPLISAVCDRLIALDLGRVISEGTPAAVLADPVVVSAYLGTPAATANGNGHRSGLRNGALRNGRLDEVAPR